MPFWKYLSPAFALPVGEIHYREAASHFQGNWSLQFKVTVIYLKMGEENFIF